MDLEALEKFNALPEEERRKLLAKAISLHDNRLRETSRKKIEAMEKARAIKTQRVKDKINGAINVLKLYGKKITIRAISEESGVSKTTVQKYLSTQSPTS